MRFSISSAFQDFPEVLALAKAADEIGYHGLALSDHVINLEVLETAYPYTSDGSRRWEPFTPWLDPWVTVGALATVTERLQFFTSVYVLPMRNPLVVAKAVGTAAVISNNRVQLGIGTGWCEEEFDLLEQPFAKRGKRTDEMIELLHAMWQPGWVEHHGEFYDIPRLEMTPVPTERVPIFVGGISDVAMKRAARHDGWLADYLTIDGCRPRPGPSSTAGGRSTAARTSPSPSWRRSPTPSRPTTSAEPRRPASPTSSPCRGPSTPAATPPSTRRSRAWPATTRTSSHPSTAFDWPATAVPPA